MTAAPRDGFDPVRLWLDVQRRLAAETSDHLFRRYVLPVDVDGERSVREGALVLLCPSGGGRDWLASQLRGRIEALAAAGLPGGGAVVYEINSQPSLFLVEEEPAAEAEAAPDAAPAAANDEDAAAVQKRTGLSRRYTFDSYCAGPGNELAVAAGRKLAAGGVAAASPLVIHGPVGVGKTHLAHAIGNLHLASRPAEQVRCVSAEQFMREVQQAFTGDGRRYRRYGLLIIDDVQHLRKESKQTATQLASLLSYRDEHGLPTVVTSDRDLAGLEGHLSRALRSRLAAGLAVPVARPDFATRVAILRSQARSMGAGALPPEAARALAQGLDSNCRELIGALRRLLFEAEFRQVKPGVELARKIVRGIATLPARLSMRRIIEACADYFKVSVAALLSKKRQAQLVLARHVAMFLCRDLTQESLPAIGKEFGCHHTSVLHATGKVAARLKADVQLAESVRDLRESLVAA
ncbi:MAG: ATP-binding protein [Betaproteobacteria bacterium AqS2]|uniref:Chromosomal replication initiator protein DnaA n=1 Tax=Candidatus Amphirhobacter heronislandensis TaxID=1732024 RepID=A0A930XYK3_9GAMM|nr:ATP-binding protein [Betaproteobacteria bacterium AqS2]